MTQYQSVVVIERKPGPVHGYTTVRAQVDGGEVGDYTIANEIVGRQTEVDEIAEQHKTRLAVRAATRPGRG